MTEQLVDRPKENWTKFPNCILDNLDKYDPYEFKVLALMIRKNLGYDDPNKKFAIRYIAAKTKLSKPTVISAINSLLEKKSISKTTGLRGIGLFEINWSVPLTGKSRLPLPVNAIDHSQVNAVDQVKENNSKIKHSKKTYISSDSNFESLDIPHKQSINNTTQDNLITDALSNTDKEKKGKLTNPNRKPAIDYSVEIAERQKLNDPLFVKTNIRAIDDLLLKAGNDLDTFKTYFEIYQKDSFYGDKPCIPNRVLKASANGLAKDFKPLGKSIPKNETPLEKALREGREKARAKS